MSKRLRQQEELTGFATPQQPMYRFMKTGNSDGLMFKSGPWGRSSQRHQQLEGIEREEETSASWGGDRWQDFNVRPGGQREVPGWPNLEETVPRGEGRVLK